MKERRKHPRELITLQVKLYHSSFGECQGVIYDISSGGALVSLDSVLVDLSVDDEEILLKPFNMDVLFNMGLMRVYNNYVALKFLDP